jgi:AcrR family transcriptional regulator
MARPKASDYDAQRDAILALAVDAFSGLGYASASMAQLAQACGTSKARLYHYFPSKEAVLFEALDRYTRRLLERVRLVQARGLAPRDELRALLHALMAEYHDSRAHLVSLLDDVKFLGEPQRHRIESTQRQVVEAVADTLDRLAPGRFTRPQRKPATMALLGMVNFTFAWLRPDGPMTHAQYADLVADLWERGVLEPAEAARFISLRPPPRPAAGAPEARP